MLDERGPLVGEPTGRSSGPQTDRAFSRLEPQQYLG